MRKITLTLLLLLPFLLKAQKPDSDCSFDNINKYTSFRNENTRFSFDLLKDERYIEYLFEGENIVKYETIKKIVRINDDRAVNIYNKFSIPLFDVFDITEIKVRTVDKEGKIFELDKSNIKEVENLDEEGNFKRFAIDGVGIGSLVEINFTTKKAPRLYGGYSFQNEGYTYNALLQIVAPQHLQFDAKSYNSDFIKKDSIGDGKRYLTLTCDSIGPLDENEAYSFPVANKARIEYSYRLNTEYHTVPYYSYTLAT